MDQQKLAEGYARAMAAWCEFPKCLCIICESIATSVPGVLEVDAYVTNNHGEPEPLARYASLSATGSSVHKQIPGTECSLTRQFTSHGNGKIVLVVAAMSADALQSVTYALDLLEELVCVASRGLVRVEAEMQEMAYRKLLDSRSDMIAALSHELRTPLASIKGYATSLLRDDVSWDNDTRQEFLRIISDESDRLEELIDSVLDMTAMESGNLPIEKCPVLLQRLIPELVERMRSRTNKHSLNVRVAEDIPVLEIDPRRISQVVYNLLDNAIKYSPKGGGITVSATLREEKVIVSVADEGMGMPEEHLSRLFDKFFRGRNTGVRGVGLGLPIAQQIVTGHGGRIWAESQLGIGTTVYFSLPVLLEVEEHDADAPS